MRSLSLCFIATLFTLGLFAEEGMWLPNKLKQTCAVKMAAAGCKISPEEIYSGNTPLKMPLFASETAVQARSCQQTGWFLPITTAAMNTCRHSLRSSTIT